MSKPPLLPDWNETQRMRSIFSAIVSLENVVSPLIELKKERVIPWELKEYLLAARKLKAIGKKDSLENERLGHHIVSAAPSAHKDNESSRQETVLDAIRYKEAHKLRSGDSTSRITPL